MGIQIDPFESNQFIIMERLRDSMSSIFSSKFRFIIYIVVGFVLIIVCALLTGATMPLMIDNFRYQGRGGYEAGGILGMQLGIIGVILIVLIIEVLRTKTEEN